MSSTTLLKGDTEALGGLVRALRGEIDGSCFSGVYRTLLSSERIVAFAMVADGQDLVGV
jgi:hypothetical protein